MEPQLEETEMLVRVKLSLVRSDSTDMGSSSQTCLADHLGKTVLPL